MSRMERMRKQGKRTRGQADLEQIEAVRNFLCGYQLCADMLHLRRYERRRARVFCDECDCDDLLRGSEAFWRARMFAVGSLINSMENGRQKLMLYYHYIHGESIEHIADMLGVSRRTGYRIHQRALCSATVLFEQQKECEKPCAITSAEKE